MGGSILFPPNVGISFETPISKLRNTKVELFRPIGQEIDFRVSEKLGRC